LDRNEGAHAELKAKSVVVALAAVVAMLLFGSGTASANVAWCIFDPPVQVVTPGGATLTVNNTISIPASAQNLRAQVWDEASAQPSPDGGGGTLITVTVHLPAGVRANVTSSVDVFQASDDQSGVTQVILHVEVPIS
jgi:hypothetical protein